MLSVRNTHLNITLTALSDPKVNDTLIANIINANFDACLSGLSYPDVGIFEYWTNFKAYKGLHNYNAVDEMLKNARNDRDRAFAYCFKIHLAEDAVSHNLFVPKAIKTTKLPNEIIHAAQELIIDGHYLDIRATRLMENHAEFDWLVEKATGRDWSKEAANLNTILGGSNFYAEAYNVESGTFIGKVERFLYALTAKFVPETTGVDYYKLAIEEAKAVLRGETGAMDPSGEAALKGANESTQLWLYLGSIVLIIVIFIVSFKKRWIGFHKGA